MDKVNIIIFFPSLNILFFIHLNLVSFNLVLRQTVSDVKLCTKFGLFLSCSYDKLIKIWSMDGQYNLVSTLMGHQHSITMMALNSSESLLSSVSTEGVVNIWPFHFESSDHLLNTSRYNYQSQPIQLIRKTTRKE